MGILREALLSHPNDLSPRGARRDRVYNRQLAPGRQRVKGCNSCALLINSHGPSVFPKRPPVRVDPVNRNRDRDG